MCHRCINESLYNILYELRGNGVADYLVENLPKSVLYKRFMVIIMYNIAYHSVSLRITPYHSVSLRITPYHWVITPYHCVITPYHSVSLRIRSPYGLASPRFSHYLLYLPQHIPLPLEYSFLFNSIILFCCKCSVQVRVGPIVHACSAPCVKKVSSIITIVSLCAK